MTTLKYEVALATLLVVVLIGQTVEQCPSVCICYGDRAHCTHAGLTEIPTNLPAKTVYLHLEGNNISSVSKDALAYMTSLRRLYLMNNRITNRGIPPDAFVSNRNLRILDLSNNLLTAVPQGLTGLWQLNLAKNKITSIPRGTLYPRLIGIAKIHLEENYLTNDAISPRELSGLHTLQQVFLSDNQLTEIPSFGSARLNHLYIGGNNISRIQPNTFSRTTGLTYLNLGRNNLDNPGLETGALNQLSNLLYLWLRENKLTGVPAGLPQRVKKLHLEGNLITAIEANAFVGTPLLRYLYISDNGIDEIKSGAFTGLGGLQYLELSGNELQHLSNGSFRGLPLLSILKMDHCNITVMRQGAFEGLHEVTLLDLDHSHIETIEDDAFVGLIDVKSIRLDHNRIQSLPRNIFKGMSTLTTLTLAYNRIRDVEKGVFEEVNRLVSLDLTGNGLTSLPVGLEDMPSLRTLVLANNSIREIPEDTPPNSASVLTLSSNPLQTAHLNRLASIFPRLSSLYLADVGIQTIKEDDFTGMGNLQMLNLDENNISDITGRPFDSLPSLSRVDIQRNRLTKVPSALQNLTNIQSLALSGNPISALSNDSFQGLNNVRILFLSDIDVTEIDSGVFKQMQNIFRIFLNGNANLKSIDLNTFRVPTLKYLYLQNSGIETIYRGQPEEGLPPLQSIELYGNPLNCDCRLEWMLEWSLVTSDVTCFKPSGLRGLAVKDLFADDFICPEPSFSMSSTALSLGQNSLPVTYASSSTGIWSTTTPRAIISTTRLALKQTTGTVQHSGIYTKSPQPPSSTVIPCDLKCQNGGQCVVMVTNVQQCRCQIGFMGQHCETPRHEEEITVTEINDTSLKIAWPSPMDDVPYKVYVKEDGSETFKEIAVLPPESHEYVLHDLDPNTQYIVCVTPVNQDQNVPAEGCHKVTTHAQSSRAGNPGKGTAFGLTVVAICAILVCAVLGVIFYRRKKRKQREDREVFPKPEENDHELQQLNDLREQFVPDVVVHAKDASNYVRLEDEEKSPDTDKTDEKLGKYVKLTEDVDKL